jgi:hypothetical protein
MAEKIIIIIKTLVLTLGSPSEKDEKGWRKKKKKPLVLTLGNTI